MWGVPVEWLDECNKIKTGCRCMQDAGGGGIICSYVEGCLMIKKCKCVER
jgi:hypothetical protein